MNTPLCCRRLAGSALVALTSTCLLPAFAQDRPGSTTARLDPIIVTAGRREQPVSDVQASVEIVGKAEIDTYSGASVTEVLRQSVGVDARTSGANSDISVRGQQPSGGAAVLVLFNGLPRTGKFGSTDLNNYAVEDVERVEIIRGPMSALYGADASGGVINVITKPAGDGTPFSGRATVGSVASSKGDGRETVRLAATGNLHTGLVGHRLSADWRSADAYRSGDTFATDDLSALDHLSLSYSGEADTAPDTTLRWTAEAYFQDDAANAQTSGGEVFTRFEKEDRYFAGLGYETELAGGSLTLQGSYGYSDASVNRSYPSPDETTEFKQAYAQALYVRPVGSHNLLFGGGAQQDEIDVTILTETGESQNLFAFIQDEWNVSERIKIVGGVRLDDFDSFDTQLVPRVSIGSRGNGLTWRAGYGEAYRAPSVIERYGSFIRGGRVLILGSPDIEPEESETWEAAIGWRSRTFQTELVYHDSHITNLIEAQSTGEVQDGLFVTRYGNIAAADISGVEWSAIWNLGMGLTLDGSYAYLDAIDGASGERLTGRAEDTYKAALDWSRGDLGASLRARHLSGFWAADSTVRGSAPFSSDYTVVDLQVRYDVSETLGVSVGIDNILDELTPANWSGTGQIEDPAGRYVYFALRFALGVSR